MIVGVGQVNDRPDRPEDGLHSGELMVAALERADRDAGHGWLSDVESLAIVRQISFPDLDPLDGWVADRCKMKGAAHFQSEKPHGDMPVRLLSEAANAIGSGQVRIAAIAGGEALRTAATLARQAKEGGHHTSNALGDLAAKAKPSYPSRYGLRLPIDVYPLYENALRANWGQSLAEAQDETGRIWSAMSRIAAANDAAWLGQALEPSEICQPGERNPPIAHPYTKLMVANASVNQGAAFLVASLAEARRRGVPDKRLVHVGHGAGASAPERYLERPSFDRLPSMEIALTQTLRRNGMTSADLAHAELYSCFPCVPKLAARIIDWPLDRDMTVFGGLTFGGGPIANYMSHAVAEMAVRLRGTREKGLLYGNGGYATDHHALVLSGDALPGCSFPQEFDCQSMADAALGEAPILRRDYEGPAKIETYTVFYGRDQKARGGVIVARKGEARTLAAVRPGDAALMAFLTDGLCEPVGASGTVAADGDGLSYWIAK